VSARTLRGSIFLAIGVGGSDVNSTEDLMLARFGAG
jgi:hypothetical protein